MDYEQMERTMQFILEQQAQNVRQVEADARWKAESKARWEQIERTMQFIVGQQAESDAKWEQARVESQARWEQMDRTMQFIVNQQADHEVKFAQLNETLAASIADNEVRFAQLNETLAVSIADNKVRFAQIGETLAVLLADRDTRLVETDKLHDDIVLLSKTVSAHHEQIQALTVLMGRLTERVDRLAEIIRLTRDNGHDGRRRDAS